jgi:UDP-GlcNAc:undecaprenyl-phosphate/decaprenyl-phosphate GlcNAc-1-phosphate transferase
MNFPLNVYVLAVVSSCLVSALTLPLWRRWCIRGGLVDEPGHRKLQDQPVPLAGGFAVMTGLLLPTIVFAILIWTLGGPAPAGPEPVIQGSVAITSPVNTSPNALLRYGLGRRVIELTGILVGALGMLVVGWVDDRHELRPSIKFAGQILIALLVAASGVRITLFVPNPIFHYAITMLWIVAVINAFNFMDNMNGLCAGLGAIGAFYFAIVAAADVQYLVALIALMTFGALLGFLPHNFPRARAFLGDAGSHLVGYLLAVLAILPHFYTSRHPRRWAVLIPLLVLAVPLLDMAWVVVLRWRKGQPFYVGDTNHLSHRLVRRGFSRVQAVLIVWLLAAALGGLIYLC